MLESATNFALKMVAIPSEVIIEVAFRPKFSHWHFPSKPNKPLLYCCLRHGTPRRCWCVSPSLRILSAGELNHTLRKSTSNRSAYKYNVFLVQWGRPLQFKNDLLLWLLSIWIISSWMCLICLRFSIFISLFESWYDFRKEADIEFTTNTFMDPILQKNMGLYLESMRKKSKKWPRSKIVSKFWCSAKHIDKNRQISWFELTIFAEWRGQTNYSKYHEFSVCLEPLPYQS